MSDKAVFKYVSTLNILICHTAIIIQVTVVFMGRGSLAVVSANAIEHKIS